MGEEKGLWRVAGGWGSVACLGRLFLFYIQQAIRDVSHKLYLERRFFWGPPMQTSGRWLQSKRNRK